MRIASAISNLGRYHLVSTGVNRLVVSLVMHTAIIGLCACARITTSITLSRGIQQYASLMLVSNQGVVFQSSNKCSNFDI